MPLNVLHEAKRLNVWNDWNGLIPVVNGAERLTAGTIGAGHCTGKRAASLVLLERAFQHEKAAPKLLNRAYSALFFS